MRSWSRLVTSSRAAWIAATISASAAARPTALGPVAGDAVERSGSSRTVNRSTSLRAISVWAIKADSTYSWLKVDPV